MSNNSNCQRFFIGLALLVTGLPCCLAYQLTDPSDVLQRASEACRQLDFIEYTSLYEQGGLRVEAQVIHKKADVADVGFGKAKVLVRGDRAMGGKTQPFQFSYDGTRFKFHEPGKGDVQVIENPTPKAVGRVLGFFYYAMVKRYLTDRDGLDFLKERQLAYSGEENINGQPAIRLDVTSTMTRPDNNEEVTSTYQWYFDRETYLPVKRVVGSVTNYMNLTSESLAGTSMAFDINADDDYSEMTITGTEAKTDGLLAVGTRFPDFLLQEANGPRRSLKDVTDKVTIIDFWGTWCGPCIIAMPDLQDLYSRYHDRGLNVVGISVNDKPGKAEKFIEKKGYSYQFLVQGDALAAQLRVDTFPTVYIVDSDGIILHAEKGKRDQAKDAFKSIIEKHIN